MEQTDFKLHEDPEEVTNMEMQIDPDMKGFFNLDQWLALMQHKWNYIEEDLIKAYRVFDLDDTELVSRDELKGAFMNFIGKD